MRYFPHTETEIAEMLKVVGAKDLDALFEAIPEGLRQKKPLRLPQPLSEQELRAELESISKKNKCTRQAISFLGGGAYNHYVPSPISQLINRGEFFTAYTPYQPEVSQGTLQALFEYQSMLCELTGMDVANASNYDVSTACAESLLMANRINGRKKALIAQSVHPQYRRVMKTYLEQFGIELVEIPFKKNGTLDTFILDQKLDDSVTCVLVQSPNFFGVIEDLKQIGESTHKKGALFVTAASEALSTAILQTPAEVDADIAVFEGQSFGVGLNFGGPYLGIFTTKQQYLRSMPGRLVGETVDQRGKRGYVLTFSTREQHIRREKATSNICTNQGLCALMATIYLSLMGKEGLVRLAEINLSLAQYAKSKILENSKIKLMFDSPTFNEFVIDIPKAGGVLFELQKKNIFAGISLMEDYPDLHDGVLVTVTEMNSKEQIDTLVNHINHLVV